MWPGLIKSLAWESGSAKPLIVRARSEAEIPVVVPSIASTETVNLVPWRSLLEVVIMGISRRWSASSLMGTQSRPLACEIIKFTASVLTRSAAITRSPSFSRFSSSTTMSIPPAAMIFTASSTLAKIFSVCKLVICITLISHLK